MSVEEVGEVGTSCRNIFYWVIPSFSLLPKKKDTRIWSTLFDLCDNVGIVAYISGIPRGFIGINFVGKDGKQPPVKCIRLGIADKNTSEICCCDAEWTEGIYPGYFKIPKFVSEKDLKSKCNSLKEKPQFRLFCEVVNDQQIAYVHTDNACGLERLSQNLKQLYIRSKDCDFTIQVQDREFKVHKAILRARSSVIDAMFTHGLSELNSGIVRIEDFEPAIIEEFLFYVYAGKTQNLSSHNMCELYYVADQYNVPDLKEKCMSFIRKSLTIETFCDVISLATKHDETELLEDASIFFAKNMDAVFATIKWKALVRENPTKADELYGKAFKLNAHTHMCETLVKKNRTQN